MGWEALVLKLPYFFCGTLRHMPLLEAVLGHQVASTPAWLADYALYWVKERSFPILIAEPGARVEGILVTADSEVDVARMDFFEGGFGFSGRAMEVMQHNTAVEAVVFHPDACAATCERGGVWDLEQWQQQFGAEFVAMAKDYLALFGVKPPRAVAARFEQMLAAGHLGCGRHAMPRPNCAIAPGRGMWRLRLCANPMRGFLRWRRSTSASGVLMAA